VLEASWRRPSHLSSPLVPSPAGTANRAARAGLHLNRTMLSDLESGFSCIPFILRRGRPGCTGGLQFNYQTRAPFSTNLRWQYSSPRTLSAQVAYVFTTGSDLQAGVSATT